MATHLERAVGDILTSRKRENVPAVHSCGGLRPGQHGRRPPGRAPARRRGRHRPAARIEDPPSRARAPRTTTASPGRLRPPMAGPRSGAAPRTASSWVVSLMAPDATDADYERLPSSFPPRLRPLAAAGGRSRSAPATLTAVAGTYRQNTLQEPSHTWGVPRPHAAAAGRMAHGGRGRVAGRRTPADRSA